MNTISKDEYIEMKRLVLEYERNQEQVIVEPILVGHLNKVFGFNGYEQIPVGSDVFLFQDRYFFYMFPLGGGKPLPCKFYKETLSPCINFLDDDRRNI